MELVKRARVAFVSAVLAVVVASPSPQAQEQPLIAGEAGVPIPKRTKMVKVVYPPEAQANGIRGIVILDLTIDKNGKVTAVDVVRSIPGLDDAAIEAVKQWEYEPAKVGGKPAAVKLTVPITFLMPVPEITRQEGIPEFRQGAVPTFPKNVDARGTVSAVAEVTLDAAGKVVEAEIRGGQPPYTDALLQAVRTWVFASDPSRGVISFRVQADFIGGDRARVALSLAGLRLSEAGPGPSGEPSPAAQAAPPASVPSPAPTPPPPVAPTPAVQEASPNSTPSPAASASPAPSEASGSKAPASPSVEILPAPAQAPPKSESGSSAVRDVTLGQGLPELSKGRRPVPPPFARMAGVTGTVSVRFAIDASGAVSVQGADGPDLLRPAAEQAVVSWVFRRTTTDRLHAVADITYREDGAVAAIRLEP